jgi:nucleoside-diphosphate-sugar epimerase
MRWLPSSKVFTASSRYSNDYHFSIAKAARELGYSPQVGVDEAFRRTAEWFKDYNAGSG